MIDYTPTMYYLEVVQCENDLLLLVVGSGRRKESLQLTPCGVAVFLTRQKHVNPRR